MKTGGRPIKHARYYWMLLAEKSPDANIWGHAAEDRGAAGTGGTVADAGSWQIDGGQNGVERCL